MGREVIEAGAKRFLVHMIRRKVRSGFLGFRAHAHALMKASSYINTFTPKGESSDATVFRCALYALKRGLLQTSIIVVLVRTRWYCMLFMSGSS